jgi:hypothetical protein
MLLAFALLAVVQDTNPATLQDLLSRVAEEAEVFAQNIPKALTTETLEQRTLLPPSRFHPRFGKTAIQQAAKPRSQTRQIVSEYSVGTLKESASGNLTEFRQVESVDGRKVQSRESARHALSIGLRAPDDRARKRMLEDFARHGLVDVATDYGLILLTFTKRGQQEIRFTPSGEAAVGADDALVLDWQQTDAAQGMLEFIGNQVTRRAMRGRLLVRKSDGLPLRVQVWTQHPLSGHEIRDEATVDYIESQHGFLTPASVVHRHLMDGQVITENRYRYDPFKLFMADTEIKFTELDSPTPPPPVKK